MLNNAEREDAMTDSSKRCNEQRAVDEQTIGAGPSAVGADSSGARRDNLNWAWTSGAGHYDWMDHAPLFHHRD
ncbi:MULTISPECIES: hypothetical protein [unclassified Caballeronia]|uniref:hypothetical protein n=1 Tax=unclassified Caballeronia TaxID=2646786 RepID=UPI001F46ED74|nr:MULTISPECIES: hypothetical protein [unclassified Caballeronia]MCE4546935.1 hypothetical protein [Caballeronia sp. PC1]MCE4572592.1 hypothetical protein [Caballeronia sp. CLC5]